ncbi:DUF934 domain-containing protein [Paraburkholderia sp. SIMBA_030]|uniref:DUF934 domain-containing protein n=1 Tax=Paraburkholderia sp. SIMBA_030 TaxID=3085773 RepID=UPI00397AB912
MYQYTEFDKSFVRSRAAQFRDQLERWQSGKLSEDDFRPLRLQNGWYVQRHAPMLRVAVPYGELSSEQLRMLARIAREYDEPEADIYRLACEAQRKLGTTHLPTHYAHFTTRTNVQFNWIPLSKAADVMDLLASVDMHGIQTSGNCIRNISCDERAGVAPDEIADPRPFAEIMRQWTTLHPEFAFLPRKFKIAVTGATEDRAATDWHDVGLRLLKDDAGELGFRVTVGGGMGRTPMISVVLRDFLPWHQIMNYIEAVVRVYNRYGRRDNKYKARIKILVKAEGQGYIDEVDEEFRQIVERDGGPHTIPQAELDRVSASFVPPGLNSRIRRSDKSVSSDLRSQAQAHPRFGRWLQRNVAHHKHPAMRVVTLSFKRLLQAPGDASADQLDVVAELAERFSAGEARVTHTQNIVLPWVHADDLFPLWKAACDADLASANVHLLTNLEARRPGAVQSSSQRRSLEGGGFPVTNGTRLRILTAADHLADGVTASLQLGNDADPMTLAGQIEQIARIDLHFPHFTDGRAYSQAYLLRRRLGFKGDLRATGDVLIDQLVQMERTGFSSAVLKEGVDPADAKRQFERFPGFYQADAAETPTVLKTCIAEPGRS